MVQSLELSIVFWLRYIALKFLWRIWESDVKEGPPFHTFLHIFYKTFTILLCNKQLHKKFAPILIVAEDDVTVKKQKLA